MITPSDHRAGILYLKPHSKKAIKKAQTKSSLGSPKKEIKVISVFIPPVAFGWLLVNSACKTESRVPISIVFL